MRDPNELTATRSKAVFILFIGRVDGSRVGIEASRRGGKGLCDKVRDALKR